ncbi:MAG: flagellar hook-length control protein FliK [Methylovulum sp.]|nr:flagellar hook-length control protein FliK [Methylovulum sp.]MCF7997985.1 flagellar hook-length control protein FliK [Methylovulum sp.]
MTIEGLNLSAPSSSVKVQANPSVASDKAVTDTEFAETLKNQFQQSERLLNEDQIALKIIPDDTPPPAATNNTEDSTAALLDMLLPSSASSAPTTPELPSPLETTHLALPESINASLTAAVNQPNPAVAMTLPNVTITPPTSDDTATDTPPTSALTSMMPSNLNLLGMTDSGDASADSGTPATPELQDLPDTAVATEVLAKQENETPQPGANTTPVPVTVEQKQDITSISKPLNHPGWSQDLGQQVVWLYNKAMPSAEISLNPEHLGPISIKIEVNQDDTSIQFSTPHLAVKEALEASIPKLREMLGTQQLNLLDVNVQQQSFSNQHQQHTPNPAFADPQGQHSGGESLDSTTDQPTQIVEVNGLVSLYA